MSGNDSATAAGADAPSPVKAFFSAPVFPGDDDKTIAASMVHHGIVFGLLANLVSIPGTLLAGDPPLRVLATAALMVGALLLNLVFLRRGHVRGAGAVFLAAAWLTLAAVNYTAGGLRAPGFSTHIVFILCVGFIYGGKWVFLAASLSAGLGACFWFLDARGLLPPPQVLNSVGRIWAISATNFFVVAAILWMMVGRLRRSIAEHQREIAVRLATERELARHQVALEGTVRERTGELAASNASLQLEVQERRGVEETLRRERDFIGQLMETSPVGIMEVDGEGRFVFANAAAAYFLGRTREQIAGLSCASPEWRFTNHDGTAIAEGDLPFVRALAGGVRVHNAPLAVGAPDGGRVLLVVNANPLGESGDTRRGCVVTLEDVTERVRLEQEMFRAQKLESVGVLAGGIAHDFNNLLTGIMGNISLALLEVPQGGAVAETLAEAEKAAFQARDLTQQLLTFSRGGQPVKQTVAIGELLANAARFTLRGSNVRAETTIPRDLWAVEADPGQIAQVFHNLVINAYQAMPRGGAVRLEAANLVLAEASPLPAGRYVKVTVADQGAGIPPEHLAKIFDPFFSTKQGGTGLGLAVVYSVMKNHGGRVAVESAPGVGTTFTLLLPASAATPSPAAAPAQPCSGRGRILLMDDEPLVRQVIARMVAALGYEVRTAADGSAAVALYTEGIAGGCPYDAVILDLTVPGGMGGAETIARLRALDPQVKAIVSSGYSNDPVMSNFADYGFRGVVTKPFQAGTLSQVLRRVLSGEAAPT